MHTAKFASLLAAGLVLPGIAFAQQPSSAANAESVPAVAACRPQPAPPPLPSIQKIRAHVRFLSLDLLEGRGPGTRGAELAAEYIATQFALSGLQPAGDNGSYFQKVPLFAVHTIEDKTKFAFVPSSGEPIDLTYGSQIVSKDQTGQSTADFDAPIVFVGYGIHAPEYNWDDYAGVDLKGKIALVIVNEPPSDDEKFFKGKTMTYYGRWTYKYEEASRRGAIGVLIIHRTDLASYGWQVVQNSQAIEKSYLAGDPSNTLRAAAWIQHDVAQHLFTLAGLGDLDQAIDRAGKRGFRAQEINVRLKAHIESRVRKYDSTNVVARVPGPQLTLKTPCSSLRITITSVSIPTQKATASTTALPTTALAAASFSNLPGPSRNPPSGLRMPCTSPRLRRKNRAFSVRNILASIRRFRRGTSRSTSTTTCCFPSAFRSPQASAAPSASTSGPQCRQSRRTST